MLAKRPTARMVLIVSVIMFALIAAFMFWAAVGESGGIGAPISTSSQPAISTRATQSTESMTTPSSTP